MMFAGFVLMIAFLTAILVLSSAGQLATDHLLLRRRDSNYVGHHHHPASAFHVQQQQQQQILNGEYETDYWLRAGNNMENHPMKIKNMVVEAGKDNNNNPIPASTVYPYPLEIVPEDYNIRQSFQPLGGGRYSEYVQGIAPYVISPEIRKRSDLVAESRKVHIRKSFQFAWKNYVQYAFGYDEIKPITGKGENGWGGQGITLVDTLDTLWLLDMMDEFEQARDWVRDHLDHSRVKKPVSMFETTIRDLGGLLSAYDWSHDPIFFEKAVDLGERLLHGFDGSTTGIPFGSVDLRINPGMEQAPRARNFGWTNQNAILAEFTSIQLEFRYLAKVAHRPELAEKTDRVFQLMHDNAPPNGLYPNFYKNPTQHNNVGITPGNQKITFGAMSDSFYEYMLKLWIQSGKAEPMFREMYDQSMDGMHNELLQKSTPSGLYYIADKNDGKLHHKMDHLVCFMGGLLALGAYTDPNGLESPRAQRDLQTARALTYTCYQMYARMNTGISPEFIEFRPGNDFVVGRDAPHYLLRPEAVESMFILNQLTGDPIYREWGWEIFQAIEKYCKTKYGYGSLVNVQKPELPPKDKMESFFLAETLKYLYLLQDPDTPIDVLHTHVFNTEAHPLRIFPVLDSSEVTNAAN